MHYFHAFWQVDYSTLADSLKSWSPLAKYALRYCEFLNVENIDIGIDC